MVHGMLALLADQMVPLAAAVVVCPCIPVKGDRASRPRRILPLLRAVEGEPDALDVFLALVHGQDEHGSLKNLLPGRLRYSSGALLILGVFPTTVVITT